MECAFCTVALEDITPVGDVSSAMVVFAIMCPFDFFAALQSPVPLSHRRISAVWF